MKSIATDIEKINKNLEFIEKDFNTALLVGRSFKDQKLALTASIIRMAAVPICFIPVGGTLAAVAMTSISSYLDPKKNSTLSSLTGDLLTQVSVRGMNKPKDSNTNPILAWLGGGEDVKGDPINKYQAASAERFL